MYSMSYVHYPLVNHCIQFLKLLQGCVCVVCTVAMLLTMAPTCVFTAGPGIPAYPEQDPPRHQGSQHLAD